MATAKRNEIIEKAIELWRADQLKSGSMQLAELTPEIEELREGGYLSTAQSELMRDNYKAEVEGKDYFETQSFVDFQFDTAEAMQTTTFISGSRGVGKSDIAMYVVDQLKDVICVVFDSSLDWIRRSSISQYITVKPYANLPIPEQNTIIDMSVLTPNQQQQCVEQFCERLFQHQIETECAKRFYLVFEESQIFFPLNSLRSKKTQNSMRILTVGRNIGVSVCAISQFPSLIDKELIKHSGQIYIGYTTEKNAVQYWKGILGKNADRLKELENGQFLYYCRNKLSKIAIEPYENRAPKTQIVIPEPQLIVEPLKSNSDNGLTSLMSFLLWFIAIIFALSTWRGL